MSLDCKKILNPLQRDGASQAQRLVRALHPSTAQIDEREMEDLLLYARDYAQLIRYFSMDNKPDGDWLLFIERDISTLVSVIAKEDLLKGKKEYDQLTSLPELFLPVIELAYKTQDWFSNAIEGLQLYPALQKLIKSILSDSLRRTIGYLKRYEEVSPPLSIDLTAFDERIWSVIFSDIQKDSHFLPSGATSDQAEMQVAMDLVRKEYLRFYNGLRSIQLQAPDFLQETIDAHPKHQPHMALFLAFLSIFKMAQNHLNTLTRRHLNYYYQEVLQLEPLPPKPDEVHMIFQLAKGLEDHLIEEKTELKAKIKDDNGANLYYATDNDLLVNKTQLDEEEGLKTVFLQKKYEENGAPDRKTAFTINNIYAAPKANTEDGLGEELTDAEGKWLTLGGNSMPYGKVGFAIASPMFLMKEGDRTMTISLYFDTEEPWAYDYGHDENSKAAHEIRHNITPYYSGEKGWVQTRLTRVLIEKNSATGESPIIIHLTIGIKAGEEAVFPYNSQVLEDGLNTTFPVLKFIFDNDGLEAQALCGKLTLLTDKTEADDKIPGIYKSRILRLLNEAETWVDIAAVEPQLGPVIDNPFTGYDQTGRGYDIGENVAKEIIALRNCQDEKSFKSLSDLFETCDGNSVTGLGVDKMNDLYYTACLQDAIFHIKANARIYARGTNYPIGTYVIHDNEYFKARTNLQNQVPHPAAETTEWKYIPKSYPYKYFWKIDVHQLRIEVVGANMQDLILENDLGSINPAKPFLPFGPLPKKGSKFFIGSHEVFQKKLASPVDGLDNLILEINWADLPGQSFKKHYEKYTSTGISNNNHFKTKIDILKNNAWRTISSDEMPPFQHSLFEKGTDEPDENRIFEIEDLPLERYPSLEPFTNYQVTLSQGFLKFELRTDFFHNLYVKEVTKAAVAGASGEVPNEPYTPVINSLKLSYRSVETINYKSLRFKDRVESLFHLEPFGWKEIFPFDNDVDQKKAVVTRSLVPEFQITEPQDTENLESITDAEGTLYVGLKDLAPPQSVSILFQVAEGSSDPDLDPQTVIWSYMANNRWEDFKTSEILEDGTNGLLTSGILTLAMPREMTDNNTSLKNGLHWIKASVARQTAAICKAIAVMPQAVKATFQLNKGNDPNRLKDSLEKETINKLRTRQAAIKKLLQPFASFDGKVEEQIEAPKGVEGEDRFKREYNEYYIRISERLRHKNRGVTIFDYERLVLQRFPDIYKVKCLNHTRLQEEGVLAPEHAPGYVKLIVLPNLRNKNAVNPFEPKVSLNRLDEVKKYLQPLISGFVNLEVKNPIFEKVQVHFKVKFHPLQEANRGYYENKLNEDIKRFLSPWLYDEGQDLELGGRVHRSVILNYIEERDYVDFVTDFTMDHLIEKENDVWVPKAEDVEEAVATSSSSVIVTAEDHIIENDIQVACLTQSS